VHVEEIIQALKALPQCMKANIEATKMSAKTPSGVKKSRSKKERSKQEKAANRKMSRATHFSSSSTRGWLIDDTTCMDSGCQTSIDEMCAPFTHHRPGVLHIAMASALEAPIRTTGHLAHSSEALLHV
jgi:hypothetical protein